MSTEHAAQIIVDASRGSRSFKRVHFKTLNMLRDGPTTVFLLEVSPTIRRAALRPSHFYELHCKDERVRFFAPTEYYNAYVIEEASDADDEGEDEDGSQASKHKRRTLLKISCVFDQQPNESTTELPKFYVRPCEGYLKLITA